MAYSGVLGAYRYAFRESPSWLFRLYTVVSALIAAYVGLLLLLALVTWIANPTGRIGERALLGVVGIVILAPLAAPVLIVARRYRRDAPRTADRPLALAGTTFLLSVFLALFISDPNDHAVTGLLAALDSLPRSYGVAPPALAAALIAAVARLTRR